MKTLLIDKDLELKEKMLEYQQLEDKKLQNAFSKLSIPEKTIMILDIERKISKEKIAKSLGIAYTTYVKYVKDVKEKLKNLIINDKIEYDDDDDWNI